MLNIELFWTCWNFGITMPKSWVSWSSNYVFIQLKLCFECKLLYENLNCMKMNFYNMLCYFVCISVGNEMKWKHNETLILFVSLSPRKTRNVKVNVHVKNIFTNIFFYCHHFSYVGDYIKENIVLIKTITMNTYVLCQRKVR